jgi:hypothetical protein
VFNNILNRGMFKCVPFSAGSYNVVQPAWEMQDSCVCFVYFYELVIHLTVVSVAYMPVLHVSIVQSVRLHEVVNVV